MHAHHRRDHEIAKGRYFWFGVLSLHLFMVTSMNFLFKEIDNGDYREYK